MKAKIWKDFKGFWRVRYGGRDAYFLTRHAAAQYAKEINEG